MDRNEMNKKINQFSEELKLSVDQGEKRIHKLTDGLDDHDVLKTEKVSRTIEAYGDELESVLKKLGRNDLGDLYDLLDRIKRKDPTNPPEACFQRVRAAIFQEAIRKRIPNLVNDTESLDDRKAEVRYNDLQITTKQFEGNLRLLLQD